MWAGTIETLKFLWGEWSIFLPYHFEMKCTQNWFETSKAVLNYLASASALIETTRVPQSN